MSVMVTDHARIELTPMSTPLDIVTGLSASGLKLDIVLPNITLLESGAHTDMAKHRLARNFECIRCMQEQLALHRQQCIRGVAYDFSSP